MKTQQLWKKIKSYGRSNIQSNNITHDKWLEYFIKLLSDSTFIIDADFRCSEMIELKHTREWCVVNYDNEGYPGVIMDVEEHSVKVKRLHCNGTNKVQIAQSV